MCNGNCFCLKLKMAVHYVSSSFMPVGFHYSHHIISCHIISYWKYCFPFIIWLRLSFRWWVPSAIGVCLHFGNRWKHFHASSKENVFIISINTYLPAYQFVTYPLKHLKVIFSWIKRQRRARLQIARCRKYNVMWFSINISHSWKHRKNCECCPVSQLIVR